MGASDSNMARKNGVADYDTMTAPERREYAHNLFFLWLQRDWDAIVRALRKISQQLSYVELDLTNTLYPMGYCRALDSIPWKNFGQLVLKEIRVLGLGQGGNN
jgi:hypothetical protein